MSFIRTVWVPALQRITIVLRCVRDTRSNHLENRKRQNDLREEADGEGEGAEHR
jgi:hypothetical protein